MDDTAGVRAAKVRCLECGAEPAGAGRFCRRCGAPMPAADPVLPEDHRPASRPIWQRAVIIAVAACVAVACLATAIIIISNKPGTSSRPRASAAPATPPATVRWISDSFYGTGPVVAGATVYVGSDADGTVAALNAATGRLRWTYTTGSLADSSGLAVAGGTVYDSDQDGTVYALDAATGRPRWTYTDAGLADDSSGLAVAGGTVYVSDQQGTVYALDAGTGRPRWTRATGAGAGSSLTVAGGTVYVADINGTVYALDAATGRPRWTYTTGNTLESSPAVANGTVYVDDINGTVYALDAGSQHPAIS